MQFTDETDLNNNNEQLVNENGAVTNENTEQQGAIQSTFEDV